MYQQYLHYICDSWKLYDYAAVFMANIPVIVRMTMNNAVFWDVAPCSLVEVTEPLAEHAAPIFHPDDRRSAFLQSVV
jgi:hypothetical protein